MREDQFHEAIGAAAQPSPHPRFGVYRNNVVSALINALRVRFPVTAQLLGPEAFAQRAGRFVLSNLPQSPVLIDYGATFPGELAEPLQDVARLENLWWLAYHAGEATAAGPNILSALAPESLGNVRFKFHPSFGLMASAWNAGTVWRAARDGETQGFGSVPQWLLVMRPEADVNVIAVDEASYDFIAALFSGQCLADAYEACAARHPEFDLTHEIAGLFSHCIITGV